MSQKNFNQEDFIQNNEKEYQIEFKTHEIGEGINLIVERLSERGEYEIVQAPVRRSDDKIFVVWDQPFNGRILFDT